MIKLQALNKMKKDYNNIMECINDELRKYDKTLPSHYFKELLYYRVNNWAEKLISDFAWLKEEITRLEKEVCYL